MNKESFDKTIKKLQELAIFAAKEPDHADAVDYYLDAILFAQSHILINSNQMVNEMQRQSDVLLEIKALLQKKKDYSCLYPDCDCDSCQDDANGESNGK